MSIDYLETLAEILLFPNKIEDTETIYCLCTRSLVYTHQPNITKVPVDPHQILENLTIDSDDEMDDGNGEANAQSTSSTVQNDSINTNTTFESYWAENGEKIIWKSWIGIYGEYINPTHKTPAIECAEIIISPSSQKDIVESGIEEDDKFPIDNNKDTLAIPRCDSTSSSNKPPTIVTTDSMTNVTQLTMSQLDEFCKSPITSVSVTPLSESPNENYVDDINDFEVSNDDDTNRRWQDLWEEHFHEQYTKTFAEFISTTHKQANTQRTNDTEYTFINDDFDKLNDLGLPIEFGKRNTNKRRHQPIQQPTIEQYLTTERIRAAFALMGYPFEDPNGKFGNMSGKVIFRTKDIQKKNDQLRMRKIKIANETDAKTPTPTPTTPTNDNHLENDTYDIVDDILPDEIDAYDVIENADTINAQNAKRKKRKKKKIDNKIPDEIFNDKPILKFWNRRFSLFSLYDLGIKLDRESWFSVTPEKIAKYTAERCEKYDIIVDAFCGAGGNTIQFAKMCKHVIAIDLDPCKIKMAKHNAKIYGVDNKIEFIVGDYLILAEKLRADAVFLSPPWGGMEYLKNGMYNIETSLLPVPASELFSVTRKISSNICAYLPRNTNTQQLAILAGPGKSVEIQQNFLNNKLIAITAFYGNFLKQKYNNK